MISGEILFSEITYQKIQRYYDYLLDQGIQHAGKHFKKQLNDNGTPLNELDLPTFARLLVQSKIPKVFAESGVMHDTSDWTLGEEDILGDISTHVPVNFYNNGGHDITFVNHDAPIAAHLIYVSGALLRSDQTGNTADLNEVVVDGLFNQDLFNALYERRLLPVLMQIELQAQAEGKVAAITIPGIGTELFSGAHSHIIKAAFREALENVLSKHNDKFPHIDVVHYDPFSGDEPKSERIGHIDYRVCPSNLEETTGQLAYPEGTSADTHTLTSLVAWDHFSWPGNDFWPGARATDDGVKAASTNSMEVITGVKGQYNPVTGSYAPIGFANWQALAATNGVQFSGPMFVVDENGNKRELTAQPVHSANVDEEPQLTEASSFDLSCLVPSMQVLGGFVAALGVAAVAASITMLILGTAGVGALAVLGVVGVAATLTGIGMFRTKNDGNKGPEPDLGEESGFSPSVQ